MATKKQDTQKPRYHYFCHKCQAVFDSDNILYECPCGCSWLTVTDFVNPASGYFVNGERI